MPSYYNVRIDLLEHALEDLVECFDTGGTIPTIDAIVNDDVVPCTITEETVLALERARDVLYHSPEDRLERDGDEFDEEEPDEETYYEENYTEKDTWD